MKAFFVGLVFLIAVMFIAGVGTLVGIALFPLLVMLGAVLRIVISVLLVMFAIWLLGTLVILVWRTLRSKQGPTADS